MKSNVALLVAFNRLQNSLVNQRNSGASNKCVPKPDAHFDGEGLRRCTGLSVITDLADIKTAEQKTWPTTRARSVAGGVSTGWRVHLALVTWARKRHTA